jgi:hypothetical protein
MEDRVKHEDLVFGTEVFVSHTLYKISSEKLEELRATYGRCLSVKQLPEDIDERIEVGLDELEVVRTDIVPCVIVSFDKTFRQYGVVAHKKYNLGNTRCYLHSGPIYSPKTLVVDTPGKDFEDYFLEGGYIIESLNTTAVHSNGFYKCQKEDL